MGFEKVGDTMGVRAILNGFTKKLNAFPAVCEIVRGEERRTEPRSTPSAEVTLHREPMTTDGWTRMSLKTKLVFDEKTDARSHGGELLVRHRWRTLPA